MHYAAYLSYADVKVQCLWLFLYIFYPPAQCIYVCAFIRMQWTLHRTILSIQPTKNTLQFTSFQLINACFQFISIIQTKIYSFCPINSFFWLNVHFSSIFSLDFRVRPMHVWRHRRRAPAPAAKRRGARRRRRLPVICYTLLPLPVVTEIC